MDANRLPELSLIWDSPVSITAIMVGLALLPLAVMSVTSLVKLSVVFAVLRNAIGAGQVPSAAVSGLLAMILTLQIMEPTARKISEAVSGELHGITTSQKIAVRDLERLLAAGAVPLEDFMRANSRMQERNFFAGLALARSTKPDPQNSAPQSSDPQNPFLCSGQGEAAAHHCPLPGESFSTLVSAFVISEIQSAFAIGFTVFLPFLVIDLVVANLLVGLGMMMVSPVAISLPFKLLLFVLCDGWFLLCRSLVLSY